MAELSWAILSARSCTQHIKIIHSVDFYHTNCPEIRCLIVSRPRTPWPCCTKQADIFHMLGRMQSASLQKVIRVTMILCTHVVENKLCSKH